MKGGTLLERCQAPFKAPQPFLKRCQAPFRAAEPLKQGDGSVIETDFSVKTVKAYGLVLLGLLWGSSVIHAFPYIYHCKQLLILSGARESNVDDGLQRMGRFLENGARTDILRLGLFLLRPQLSMDEAVDLSTKLAPNAHRRLGHLHIRDCVLLDLVGQEILPDARLLQRVRDEILFEIKGRNEVVSKSNGTKEEALDRQFMTYLFGDYGVPLEWSTLEMGRTLLQDQLKITKLMTAHISSIVRGNRPWLDDLVPRALYEEDRLRKRLLWLARSRDVSRELRGFLSLVNGVFIETLPVETLPNEITVYVDRVEAFTKMRRRTKSIVLPEKE